MSQSNKIYLRPTKFVNSGGKLAYSDSAQAWSVLRLKKEILNEFSDLKKKRSKMFYDLDFVKTYDSLIEFIERLKVMGKPLPLLLWFYKFKEEIEI